MYPFRFCYFIRDFTKQLPASAEPSHTVMPQMATMALPNQQLMQIPPQSARATAFFNPQTATLPFYTGVMDFSAMQTRPMGLSTTQY